MKTAFPREYTIRIEAQKPAGVLLDAGSLIIVDDYIISNGTRHELADANCYDAICTYTTHVNEY
jgi:hypothetical protein